jgi:hypothetical protein
MRQLREKVAIRYCVIKMYLLPFTIQYCGDKTVCGRDGICIIISIQETELKRHFEGLQLS